MKTLDEELETLSKLSDQRKRAKELRDDGLRALERFTSQKGAGDGSWRVIGDEIESALVALVQSRDVTTKKPADEPDSAFVKTLMELRLDDLFGTKLEPPAPKANSDEKRDDEKVPVMVATRAMQALIASSKHAFSPASLLCYYRIVRELYSADSPDWSTGGAKAGNGGESSAFMTGESVRAISALARTHQQTADFLSSTYKLFQRSEQLRNWDELEKWRDVEMERTGLAWYSSTAAQLGELALNLPVRPDPIAGKRINTQYVDERLEVLKGALKESILTAKRNFSKASWKVRLYREKERLEAKQIDEQERDAKTPRHRGTERYNRSESAHHMAYSVVRQAAARAKAALKICRENKNNVLDGLQKLADLFETINSDVKRILEPAKRFLGASLDRELTAASATSQPVWDARELVFAAASYGAVTEWKQDERLERACALLSEAISERGLFPPGRPFHSTANGFSLYASSFEVARGFAQLLYRADKFPVTPQLVGRMLQLFEDNIPPSRESGAGKTICWHAEAPPIPRKPTLWVTAVAVLALDDIVRMLNHKINEGVLGNFSTTRYDKKEKSGLCLEELTFPDYGLCLLPDKVVSGLRPEQRRNQSVAIILEQMRAHVLGTTLPKAYSPSKFSGVLFGPPGTGKTTLMEALAHSTERPLVQITPSDIARGGEQAIEKTAKQIFDALSMLTGAVIIFDEFEPILRKRETGTEKETQNIFTFLTPGMLPKLKHLYESAKQQGVAYCLATNHYRKLDEAAIRRGRFDEHIVIYHPDFLSRAGMLLNGLKTRENITELDPEQRRRFEVAVRRTNGMNIVDLSKDLFRVRAKEEPKLDPKTCAYYVLIDDKTANIEWPKPPAAAAAQNEKPVETTKLEEWRDKKEDALRDGSLWESAK